MEHDIEKLARSIEEVRKAAQEVADACSDDGEEFLRIIRRPGFTTPAELELLLGLTESAAANIRQGRREFDVAFQGGRQVAGSAAAAG